MKKFLLFITAAALMALSACNKGGEADKTGVTLTSDTAISFEAAASVSNAHTVTFSSTDTWTATISDGATWLSAAPLTGAKGTGTITVYPLSENTSDKDRIAEITILSADSDKPAKVTVTQKKATTVGGFTLLSGTEMTFEFGDVSKKIKFKASESWTAAQVNKQEWLSIAPEAGDAGEGEVTVTILQQNDTKADRTAKVKLTALSGSSAEITLTQKPLVEKEPDPDPATPVEILPRKVKSIVTTSYYDSGEGMRKDGDGENYEFTYTDKGNIKTIRIWWKVTNIYDPGENPYRSSRLASWLTSEESEDEIFDETYTFTYTENSIILTGTDEDGEQLSATLNVSNGRIAGFSSENSYYDEKLGKDITDKYVQSYTYDPDNHLTSSKSDTYRDNVLLRAWEQNMEWKDGNVAAIEYISEENDSEYSYKNQVKYTYVYGTTLNNLNIDFTNSLLMDEDIVLSVLSFYGERAKNMPETENQFEYADADGKYSDEASYIKTYKYEHSADGYLKSITVERRYKNDNVSKSKTVFEFTYED